MTNKNNKATFSRWGWSSDQIKLLVCLIPASSAGNLRDDTHPLHPEFQSHVRGPKTQNKQTKTLVYPCSN